MIKYRLKEQGIDVVDTVLTNRGLTASQVEKILNPNDDVVEHPYLLKNMKMAVNKTMEAIKNNKKIVIPIDSDCDGWCSAGQLYHYIRYILNYKNIIYIFHKNPKAHGFTEHIVGQLKELEADLVIMADGGCGEMDMRKYHTVLTNGTEIVILDHHPFKEAYQDEVALVNCHQSGENTNPNLSGASVVYKFLQALSMEIGNQEETLRYRDLVALSLVSDLMDLRELENRVLLNEGANEINITNPFIKKLMSKNKMDKYLTIEELGFNIAPLINATVRMGKDSDKEKVFRSLMGAEELVESEKRGEKGKGILVPLEDEAVRIATNLKSNQDKKRDKAMEELLNRESNGMYDSKVFMVDVTDYMDAEISGLVANKILDVVNRPILLIRWDEEKGHYTGSARGLSESKELPDFKELCLKTGKFRFCSGHGNAFGVGISKNKLDEVKNALNEKLKDVEFFEGYEVDSEYSKAIPLAHVKAIAKYEDLWCNSIKAPLFIVKGVSIKTENIDKIGNATYTFKVGDVKFTKNFGSKVWYESVIQSESLAFGGNIIADIVCKFRKNKKGYYYCDIVDMVTKVDENEEIDF